MNASMRRSTACALVGAAALGVRLRRLGAQEPITLNVGAPPSDGIKAFLYATHAGIFKKYGLNVNTIPMPSGTAALAAIPGGSIQIAFVNLLSVINAYNRGLHFIIVGSGDIYQAENPYSLVFVRKDSPLRGPRDLNGKTVASLALRNLDATALLNWVDANGGDSKTLRVVELPASAMLSSLDEGRLDAAPITSPYLEEARSSPKYRVLGAHLDAISKRFLLSGWCASADAVAKNPEGYVRFAHAIHEAIIYSNAHLAATVELVADYTKIDPAVIAHGMRVLDAEYLDGSDLQPMLNLALKYGFMDKPIDPNDLIFPATRKPASRP